MSSYILSGSFPTSNSQLAVASASELYPEILLLRRFWPEIAYTNAQLRSFCFQQYFGSCGSLRLAPFYQQWGIAIQGPASWANRYESFSNVYFNVSVSSLDTLSIQRWVQNSKKFSCNYQASVTAFTEIVGFFLESHSNVKKNQGQRLGFVGIRLDARLSWKIMDTLLRQPVHFQLASPWSWFWHIAKGKQVRFGNIGDWDGPPLEDIKVLQHSWIFARFKPQTFVSLPAPHLQANMSSDHDLKVEADNSTAKSIQQASESDASPVIRAPPAGSWTVLVQGVALFSDGYNVQIIGYMNTVFAKL